MPEVCGGGIHGRGQWNLEPPRNRKTKRGAGAHITSWLARQQNQARQERVQEQNQQDARDWADKKHTRVRSTPQR